MPTFSFNGGSFPVEQAVNVCPVCRHAVDARFLVGAYMPRTHKEYSYQELVFQCSRQKCQRLFIGRYTGTYERGGWVYRLTEVLPFIPTRPSHPDDVAAISPQFVEIYRQASAAEGYKLTEVAGVGYRKALEFLIKDYCINADPKNAEFIKGKFLANVINDHIPDENIKACASRATWLGNDETHYVRRWDDKDIKDLKALITLTVSWINTKLLTAKYVAAMPEKK